MPCSEQSWVIPCSSCSQQGRDERALPSSNGFGACHEKEGFMCFPRAVILSCLLPWCCTPHFAELLSLPALHLAFVCGCTNIWQITNTIGMGQTEPGLLPQPHQGQFWSQCTSDSHQKEGEQTWELKYGQRLSPGGNVLTAEADCGKNCCYFRFQGVRKFLLYLVLICKL